MPHKKTNKFVLLTFRANFKAFMFKMSFDVQVIVLYGPRCPCEHIQILRVSVLEIEFG